MNFYVEAAGTLAPGLTDWGEACAVLTGQRPYQPAPLQAPRVDLLPPAERRRTGMPVKLAIAVGQQALSGAGIDAAELSTVFCSSGGDGEVLHEICSALAGPEREISPTRFHNSVQNAPAGYWGIATRSFAPSTSLGCYDWSFPAGLIEAGAQLATDCERVLLLCFDAPYPEPLASARPINTAFACSALLSSRPGAKAIARLHLEMTDGERASPMPDPELEQLRLGNPAARALPLLAALAARREARVTLEYVGGRRLAVDVAPC
jgi:hypothetical protein